MKTTPEQRAEWRGKAEQGDDLEAGWVVDLIDDVETALLNLETKREQVEKLEMELQDADDRADPWL